MPSRILDLDGNEVQIQRVGEDPETDGVAVLEDPGNGWEAETNYPDGFRISGLDVDEHRIVYEAADFFDGQSGSEQPDFDPVEGAEEPVNGHWVAIGVVGELPYEALRQSVGLLSPEPEAAGAPDYRLGQDEWALEQGAAEFTFSSRPSRVVVIPTDDPNVVVVQAWVHMVVGPVTAGEEAALSLIIPNIEGYVLVSGSDMLMPLGLWHGSGVGQDGFVAADRSLWLYGDAGDSPSPTLVERSEGDTLSFQLTMLMATLT